MRSLQTWRHGSHPRPEIVRTVRPGETQKPRLVVTTSLRQRRTNCWMLSAAIQCQANGAADGTSPLNRTLELMIRGELYRQDWQREQRQAVDALPDVSGQIQPHQSEGGALDRSTSNSSAAGIRASNSRITWRCTYGGPGRPALRTGGRALRLRRPRSNNSLMFPVAITGKLAATPHNLSGAGRSPFRQNVPIGDRRAAPIR